jgi:hypothetical protein
LIANKLLEIYEKDILSFEDLKNSHLKELLSLELEFSSVTTMQKKYKDRISATKLQLLLLTDSLEVK